MVLIPKREKTTHVSFACSTRIYARVKALSRRTGQEIQDIMNIVLRAGFQSIDHIREEQRSDNTRQSQSKK